MFWNTCRGRAPLLNDFLAGCTRTRLFIIMHDMAHHSYFTSRRANALGATLLGALTYTPYSGWKIGHDYHHRHSNNTDRKQWAQTAPLTVREFRELPLWSRWAYRLAYGHWTLCTTTPWLYFVVLQRFIATVAAPRERGVVRVCALARLWAWRSLPAVHAFLFLPASPPPYLPAAVVARALATPSVTEPV